MPPACLSRTQRQRQEILVRASGALANAGKSGHSAACATQAQASKSTAPGSAIVGTKPLCAVIDRLLASAGEQWPRLLSLPPAPKEVGATLPPPPIRSEKPGVHGGREESTPSLCDLFPRM